VAIHGEASDGEDIHGHGDSVKACLLGGMMLLHGGSLHVAA
jgi:hypothetical protein